MTATETPPAPRRTETLIAAEQIIKRVGPTITPQRFAELFNPSGRKIAKGTFYNMYARLFGRPYAHATDAPTDGMPPTPDEDDSDDDDGDDEVFTAVKDTPPRVDASDPATAAAADALSPVLRLALCVQAVGGFARARAIIDHLESLDNLMRSAP